MDRSTEMKVELTSPLDTEIKASHFLRVVAYDGGDPSLNGSLEVGGVREEG